MASCNITTQFNLSQDFRAANNSLTGSFPASAATAPDLELLSLSNNSLGGPLPDNWQAQKLVYLMARHNQISGESLARQMGVCCRLVVCAVGMVASPPCAVFTLLIGNHLAILYCIVVLLLQRLKGV